jgi:hypothetical protein
MALLNPFRVTTALLAILLTIAAFWLLLVQLIRPASPSLPEDVAAAQILADQRGSAGLAARIGLFRGDLWTDYAISLAPFVSSRFTSTEGASSIALLDRTRDAAVRAVQLAPFDARAWLLIAAVDSQVLDRNPAGALKMSFYVGPNELSLFPLRIGIATRSNAITDPELQTLLGDEIQKVISSQPTLKPYIVAAYGDALPEGKLFIAKHVEQSDRDLFVSLRANGSH